MVHITGVVPVGFYITDIFQEVKGYFVRDCPNKAGYPPRGFLLSGTGVFILAGKNLLKYESIFL